MNTDQLSLRRRSLLALVLASLLPLALQGASHTNRVKAYVDSSSCTKCHDTAADEVMKTTHWTWAHTNAMTGHVEGKRHVINNYCVALASNEPRCTSCHVGIGYKDKNFDFTDATKVDCLVCHDTTGTYKKFPTMAGAPWTGPGNTNFGTTTYPPVDLLYVAQNVGKTSRATCGACHFYGGGGDAVKHGDLDSSLKNPTRELDVHMGVDGLNFQCSTCHETTEHMISGSFYSKDHPDSASCEKCHTARPHPAGAAGDRLNTHSSRVGCQTCHIPAFARGRTTAMTWDWSTAGNKDASGKNYVTRDANGDPIYDTQKGNFTWQKEVQPVYRWFNGQVDSLTVEEAIDPTRLVTMNTLHGEISEPNARIMPLKRFTGRQPIDPVNKVFAVPHLFGSDTNAYWKGFNWTNALAAGMAYVGVPFSGEVGWAQTEMFWVQNHMVAPKEKALKCADCHVPGGRMDFASLGYPAAKAAALQTLAGFEIGAAAVNSASGRLELRWATTPGSKFKVEQSGDLTQWTDAADGAITADEQASELTWQDASPPTTVRYYRILRLSQ